MGVDSGAQALALLRFFILGLLAGLVYDLLRPPRRHTSGLLSALLDALFCLLLGAGLFSLSMATAEASLELWQLFAALLGFLAYEQAISQGLLLLLEKNPGKVWKSLPFCRKK